MAESDEKVVVNPDDHHFIWRVDGDLLQQFKCAKSHQCFDSPIYETSDGVKWRLMCYPNSRSGAVGISVHLHSLPHGKKYVAANYVVVVTGSDGLLLYQNMCGNLHRETTNVNIKRADMFFKTNISAILVKYIKFEMWYLAIYYQPEIKCGIWKINNNFLNSLRAANMNDYMISPVFEQNGLVLYMRLYPNGFCEPGQVALDLACPNISKVKRKGDESV
eukprot:201662_1